MKTLDAENEPSIFARLLEVVAVAFYFEAIGVVYSICFFAGFGLNFADYADLDDLILGSFKEPVVFVAALGVVLYLVLRKSTNKSSTGGILLLLVPVALAVLMAIAAYYYVTVAERAMPFSNTGMKVSVLLAESLDFEGGEEDRKIASVRLIGTSGDYFFFFDTLTVNGESWRSTIVLPKTSIIQIARAKPEQ